MVIEMPARGERTAADRKLLQGLRDGTGLRGRDEIIEHFMPLARSCASATGATTSRSTISSRSPTWGS